MAAKQPGNTTHEPAANPRNPSAWIFTPSAFYGGKSLSNDDWGPLKSQRAIGVGLAVQRSSWPYAIVAGYTTTRAAGQTTADAPDFEYDGATTETGVGLRHVLKFSSDSLKYSIEGGLLRMTGEQVEIDTVTNDKFRISGSGTGYWIGGAVDFMVSERLSVGIEARKSVGDIAIDAEKIAAGGACLGFAVRYRVE